MLSGGQLSVMELQKVVKSLTKQLHIPYSRVIRRPSPISAASLLGAALLLAPSYSLLGLE